MKIILESLLKFIIESLLSTAIEAGVKWLILNGHIKLLELLIVIVVLIVTTLVNKYF
ncbi:hypothetical protein IA935_01120 [Listeria marthii]|uniref:hypothetical protein n=1 Tax=Listeria marthii TaxID=529731 RepID=UPI0018874549|nr:hypothetical protein [Listeria marthii]MBF2347852.1 hypothetical protein [Listeria marthii]